MEKKKSNKLVIAVIIIIGFIVASSFLEKVILPSLEIMDEQKEEVNKVYNIGDTIKCSNIEFTINEIQFKPKGTSVDSYSVVGEPERIGIIVTAKNISNSDIQIGSNQFNLVNSNKEIIESNKVTYPIYGEYSVISSKLAPGGVKTGYIDFSNTNTDNSNLELQIDCLDFNNTIYKFNISQ